MSVLSWMQKDELIRAYTNGDILDLICAI